MHTIIKFPLVTVMLAGAVLTAQESTGSLVGTVRTRAGEVSQGARVVITGEVILGSRTTVTDANGNYRFQILPPGDYTLTVSKEGFIPSRATFRVNVGQTFRQNMSLRDIDVVAESVEITASEAVQVDKTDTKTVTNFSADRLMELPVALTGAGAQSLAPGVTNSAGQFPAFRGGLGGNSMFTIDGVATRDSLTRQNSETGFMIRDLMESVQVVQSPINSKYGNTSGGLTNLVTKSGTNSFSASFRANVSRAQWSYSKDSAPRYRRFNNTAPYNQAEKPLISNNVPSITASDDLNKDYMATVSGPVIKDHLTFSYGRTWRPVVTATSSQRNLGQGVVPNNYGYYITTLQGTSPTAIFGPDWGFEPGQASKSRFVKGSETVNDQFKLYYIINPNHQIEVNYTQQDSDSPYTWASGLEQTWEERTVVERRLMTFDYTGIVLNGVLNVKLGRSKRTEQFPSGPRDPIDYLTWRSDAASIEANYNSGWDTYRINGTFGSTPEEAQNDNYSLNYSKTIGTHNLDIGVERLQEKVAINPYTGPNNKYFRAVGMTENYEFMVYNWFNSPFAAPGYADANPAVYNQLTTMTNNLLVPNVYSVQLLPGVDYHAYNTSDSIYINDMWHINNNLSVMAGLRYDNWKIENYKGTELDTSAVSPRLEVKYDIRGDNRQLLSLSYAHFRGTIGFPTLGAYARRPTDIKILKFWSQGEPGVMYPVSSAVFLDESNYTLFRVVDGTFDTRINPDIKPEVAKQVELAYRRSFENGGFFRASFIRRDYGDNIYSRGTTEVVWDTADEINPDSRFLNYLDFDQYGDRKYYGLEIEFELPLYASSANRVTANGNWTTVRSLQRYAWGDTLTTAGPRWDDVYAAAGYSIDDYNSYGEGPRGGHNTVNLWLTWNCGRPGQVRSTVAVLGSYNSGAPESLTFNEYLPGANATYYPGETLLPRTSNSPTQLTHFIGKRGQFLGQDSYNVNMKWTLNIPIPAGLAALKRLVGFTELTINNVFNERQPSYGRSNNSDIRSRYLDTYHTNYSTIAGQRNPNYGSMSEYGVPSWSGARTYGFSAGIRF